MEYCPAVRRTPLVPKAGRAIPTRRFNPANPGTIFPGKHTWIGVPQAAKWEDQSPETVLAAVCFLIQNETIGVTVGCGRCIFLREIFLTHSMCDAHSRFSVWLIKAQEKSKQLLENKCSVQPFSRTERENAYWGNIRRSRSEHVGG